MSSRMPPRHLPTLTEVVDPQALGDAVLTTVPSPAPLASQLSAAIRATPDRHALAQQLIQLVRPQLEAELRHVAQELFEAQFSALLPSMHMHIEEAVREALDQALPAAPDELGNEGT